MKTDNQTLKMWQRMSRLPMGKRLFTKFVCHKAPYFASAKPQIIELRPGLCRVRLKKQKSLENHIGTMHVIAICNALEMAMGVMAEASIPSHLRWIPKGMDVRYPAKGPTDIVATATVAAEDWKPGDLGVKVVGRSTTGEAVVEGTIWLWISPRKR